MTVDFSRLSFSASEYRATAPATDAGTVERDPLSTELSFSTYLETEYDANQFRDKMLELRKGNGTSDWTVSVVKGRLKCQIGDTITLKYPRFGLSQGKKFIVKRIKKSQSSLFDEFTLFGPQP